MMISNADDMGGTFILFMTINFYVQTINLLFNLFLLKFVGVQHLSNILSNKFKKLIKSILCMKYEIIICCWNGLDPLRM